MTNKAIINALAKLDTIERMVAEVRSELNQIIIDEERFVSKEELGYVIYNKWPEVLAYGSGYNDKEKALADALAEKAEYCWHSAKVAILPKQRVFDVLKKNINPAKKTAVLVVPSSEAALIDRLTSVNPHSEDEYFGEDNTLSFTVSFADGKEMDIKVCGVQYEEGGDNTAYTEAVLFDHGAEVCCSEPSEDFFGQWVLESNGVEYIVDVVKEEKLAEWNKNLQ